VQRVVNVEGVVASANDVNFGKRKFAVMAVMWLLSWWRKNREKLESFQII
jgi:hypothetical protein